ncbi:right-handed parallel beta-helix repeat-containing protein [Globicatella sanguinis]|uniref:right-handed parallel beta-helix repeat-containing protein n=1 Tax=Globicatella sanguinis TaxID=13076 RepID=UPI000826D66B|nr:right-handed parallel beta-helix repeat-containing protein [Globicatella sanguinis]
MLIYVNARAKYDGDGSKEKPFKHINDAAKIAVAGDEVLVAPGLYREYVSPVNGGEEGNPIIYRSTEPLGAIISGAERITNWEPYQDNVWKVSLHNDTFGDYNPYTTLVWGDWYFGPAINHTGAVYMNDFTFYEVQSLEGCLKGEVDERSWEPEKSIYKWYTKQNGEYTEIYANFHGKNPNEENVEINVRRRVFMPKETGRNYIQVSGFKLKMAATTWAPPASFQDGLIGPHWSKGWVIEDCEVSHSKCVGISLGKYRDPENDQYFTHRHLKTPTQMERDAVCRGQYHGWTKENIGHHLVRHNHIHHCEQAGIVGRMGAVFSTIEDNHIHHINIMQELIGAEVAGIKLHAAIDVLMRRNHIHHCFMGIWCDWQAQGTRLTQNFLHDNHPPKGDIEKGQLNQDIFVEVSHGPTIIDNNVCLSKHSMRIASQGCAIIHNLCSGPFISIGGGTDTPLEDGRIDMRYTPYHIRHRTEVAGFMTFLHGDHRIYNNIFIQKWGQDKNEAVTGTSLFNEYPLYEDWIKDFELENEFPSMMKMHNAHFGKLPVWINGNVYLNGAEAFDKEENQLTLEESIKLELIEHDGHYTLETNIAEYLNAFKVNLIQTEMLGVAFEPEQRFESADETDIIFNQDFYGNHRDLTPYPGPFATLEDSYEFIKK